MAGLPSFVLCGCALAVAADYALQKSYVGPDFFDASKWSFFSGPDPTKGAVKYVDQWTANALGMVKATENSVYIGPGLSAVKPGDPIPSVRLESADTFNSGLIILSMTHQPTGCGVWPAFWMMGEDPMHPWPIWGEADFLEGAHGQNEVWTTLHTLQGCDQSSLKSGVDFSGTWMAAEDPTMPSTNCSIIAAGQARNEGCPIVGPKGTMGPMFNSAHGGTFAWEWDPQAGHIRGFFWPAGQEPADIQANAPKPDSWGVPYSKFLLSEKCPSSVSAPLRCIRPFAKSSFVAMLSCRIFACLLSALVCLHRSPGVGASAFLRMRTRSELVTQEIVESTLRAELLVDPARLEPLEKELRPMYIALPKNEHGTLEPAAVRYALHRYFVQKHGWYVKGLEPAGQGWNTSAPTDIMKSRIPSYIQSLFEQRLHGQGMGLHDLAVFAATILDLVHNEGLTDVMELYAAFNLSTTSPTPKREVDDVVKAYVLQHLGASIDSRTSMHRAEQDMIEDFPAWGEFQLWVEDVRQTISMQRSRSSFQVEGFTVGRVVEEVRELNDRLGAFQDIECRSLKAGLEDLQYKNTGRVLLSDFYRAGMRGDFLFNENVDFLRKLGVLDEADSRHPSVIIANYLASQANCLASTSFHSVCCIDECEGLIGHLERAIAGPRASPGRIAELVAGMRSDTVDAPRTLSASLLTRLGEIADHHNGLVPLHGRLFAQWMHHAYPLECPYPHSAGTVSPLTADEWMDQAGANDVAASAADRSRFIQQAELAAQVAAQASSEALPWTMKEELVVAHEHRQAGQEGSQMLRKVAAFLAVVALAVPMAKASAAALYATSGAQLEKCHLV